MKLTERQKNTLFVVSSRQPASVRDVAMSLLTLESMERPRLEGLCRRGLLTRQHTGLRNGVRVGYVLTSRGREALAQMDLNEDYDPLEGK
jgi:DNA-binding MarR family transcriptional regulator